MGSPGAVLSRGQGHASARLLSGLGTAQLQVWGQFQDGILAGRKYMGLVLFFSSVAEGLRSTLPHNGFEQSLCRGRIKM